MKTVAIIVVLILLAAAAVLIFSPKAPKDVQSLEVKESTENQAQQNENSMNSEGKVELTEFSFIGYGPGKSHTGVFEKYEVKNVKVNESGVPVAGEIVVDVNSIKTDTAMLDTHLKEKPEFFDTAKYPTLTFSLSNATETSKGIFQVSGNLTVKSVTKQVSFTVNANEDKTFSSEFKLKMSDFGFSAPGIVEDEVVIKFAGKVN